MSFIVTCYNNAMAIPIATKPVRRGRPQTGRAMTAAERMRRMRMRRKARGLRPVVSWMDAGGADRSYSSHSVIDARSLAMHVLIAAKIRRDPTLLDRARRNIQRWRERSAGSPAPWLREWSLVLSRPWPAIAAIISDMTPRSTRLRQSSPFAGILSAAERRRVYEAFRT